MSKELINSFEGKLFLSRFISAFKSNSFSLDQHYYTLKEGVVYEIHKGELHASGDDPLNLCQCIEVGCFDEKKLPNHIEPTNFDFNDLVVNGIVKESQNPLI